MSTEVDHLSGSDTGKYRIVTQGSEHIWDLDKRTWVRVQKDGLNPMGHDGRVIRIDRVGTWPSVGGVFFVWFEDQWHRSSTIRRIEKIDE